MNRNASSQSKKLNLKAIFREAIVISIWFYIFVKLFVFDVDEFLLRNIHPGLEWLSKFKVFVILGITSLAWLILGNKKFGKFTIYLLAYPAILFCWKIPILIFKRWAIAVILSPAIFGIAKTFKPFFIWYAYAIISLGAIIASSNHLLLLISMIVLFVFLLLHLVQSFKHAYGVNIFSELNKVISAVINHLGQEKSIVELLETTTPKGKPVQPEVMFNNKASFIYTAHWGVTLAIEKIRGVVRSRKMDMYFILFWAYTVIISISIFAFEYYGLYKIDPTSFSADHSLNLLSFFGFSFGFMTKTGLSSLTPVGPFSVSLCYAETICSVVVFLILIFTILTVARERYKEDIEIILKGMNEISAQLESASLKFLNLAIGDVEQLLLHHNLALVNTLRKFRGMPEINPPLPSGGRGTENKGQGGYVSSPG